MHLKTDGEQQFGPCQRIVLVPDGGNFPGVVAAVDGLLIPVGVRQGLWAFVVFRAGRGDSL